MKISLKRAKRIFRRVKKPTQRNLLIGGLALALVVGFLMQRSNQPLNYSDLLNVIAKGESNGNYNAYFGNADNSTIKFTSMTIGEVLAWQRDFVAAGSKSSAVGKYQFINTTLRGLVNEMGISENLRFDAALQDRLAIKLLERRGVHDYARGKITSEQLAYNLSQEWAALPSVLGSNPSASFYDGDGLNTARVSAEQVLAAIASLKTANNP